MRVGGKGGLVVRGDPVEGESVRGFLLRLIDANGLSGPHLFTPRHDRGVAPLPKQIDGLLLQNISSVSDAPMEALKRLGGVEIKSGETRWGTLGGVLSSRFSDALRARVCPCCLRESGFLRGLWEIPLIVACPLHGCKLLHECRSCGEPLTWNRRTLLHCCRTDAPLSKAWTESAGQGVLDLARTMAAHFEADVPKPSSRVCRDLLGLDPTQLLLLILHAGLRPEDGRANAAYNRACSDAAYMERLVSQAADVLLDWPTGMPDFVRAWDKPDAAASVAGAADLGVLYSRLQSVLRAPAFGFFHDQLWAGKLARSPWLSKASSRSKVRTPDMLASEVCRSFGVTPEWLHAWTSAGVLTRTTRPLGKTVRHSFDRTQVEALLGRLLPAPTPKSKQGRRTRVAGPQTYETQDGRVSQDEAASRLGVQRRAVLALANADIIKGGVEGGVLNLDPGSLTGLLDEILLRADAPDTKTSALLARRELVRLTSHLQDGGLVLRIQALLERRIRCIVLNGGKGLARFGVRPADVASFGALETAERPWVKMSEASSQLGCVPSAVRILVANGLLETTQPSSGGGVNGHRHVIRTSLDLFRKEWVIGSSLAGNRPVNSKFYRDLALEHGPPALAVGNVHIWPRSVVMGQRFGRAAVGQAAA